MAYYKPYDSAGAKAQRDAAQKQIDALNQQYAQARAGEGTKLKSSRSLEESNAILGVGNRLGQDIGARQAALVASAEGDQEAEARDRLERLTLGRADEINTDPRMTAAMDALDPVKTQNNRFAESSDMSAAQAGSMGEMLRQQMQSSGIGMNDPAAQAQMRSIETGRQQSNQAGLRNAQTAGQGAAAQQAQMRLSQMNLANQPLAQGAAYMSQYSLPGSGQHQSAGYQGGGQQTTQNFQPWQAPAQQQQTLYQAQMPNYSPQGGGASPGSGGKMGVQTKSPDTIQSQQDQYMQQARQSGAAEAHRLTGGGQVPNWLAKNTRNVNMQKFGNNITDEDMLGAF